MSLVAAFAASLVVGILNAGFPDLTFIIASGTLWAAGDLALVLTERNERDALRHMRVRWRVGLAALVFVGAFAAALQISQGGYLKEMIATSVLAMTSFAVGMMALKLYELRSPLEVDWRAKLQSKAPSYGFLTPPKRNVLLLGASLDARMIAGAISYAISPLKVVGAVRYDDEDGERSVCGAPVLGRVHEIEDVVAQLKTSGIVVDALVSSSFVDRDLPGDVRDFLRRRAGADPMPLLSDLAEIKNFAHADHSYRSRWRARRNLRRKLLKLSRGWPSTRSAVLKRGFDIVVSGAVLVFLAPILAAIVLGVRASLGSPVLFWQMRPGRFGRPFRIYKFRSMCVPDRRSGDRTSDQARTTRFGAFLRRSRLDELPQFVSVLRGQMSIVGPRPLLPEDMPDLAEARLLVRPGISGWAQVNGGHELTPYEKIALDIWYVKRANVLLDLWILLKSVRVVLTGDRRNERVIAAAEHEFAQLVSQLSAMDGYAPTARPIPPAPILKEAAAAQTESEPVSSTA